MNTVRIAVADDQKMFRSGLINLLNEINGVTVLIEASDGKELISALQTCPVDIAFVDYRMPELNGISTAKIIRDKFPSVRVIMLSMYDQEELIVKAIENGANGYLIKDDEPEEIQRAIESVMSIGYYANDRTSKILITKLMASGKVKPVLNPPEKKSVQFQEHEITLIKLLARELSTKEIASKMNKAERTIEGYRTDIMQKTGAKNSVGIIMYAVKKGILKL